MPLSQDLQTLLAKNNTKIDSITDAQKFDDFLKKITFIPNDDYYYFPYSDEITELLKYLLESKKLNINAVNNHGDSLLMILEAHHGCVEGDHMYGTTHSSSIELLIEKGIDPLIMNKDKMTILEYRFHWFNINQHANKTAAQIYQELQYGFDVNVDEMVARHYFKHYGKNRHQGEFPKNKQKRSLQLNSKPLSSKFANEINVAIRSDRQYENFADIEDITFEDNGNLQILCKDASSAQILSKCARNAPIDNNNNKIVILGPSRQYNFYKQFVYPALQKQHRHKGRYKFNMTDFLSKQQFDMLKNEQYLLQCGVSLEKRAKKSIEAITTIRKTKDGNLSIAFNDSKEATAFHMCHYPKSDGFFQERKRSDKIHTITYKNKKSEIMGFLSIDEDKFNQLGKETSVNFSELKYASILSTIFSVFSSTQNTEKKSENRTEQESGFFSSFFSMGFNPELERKGKIIGHLRNLIEEAQRIKFDTTVAVENDTQKDHYKIQFKNGEHFNAADKGGKFMTTLNEFYPGIAHYFTHDNNGKITFSSEQTIVDEILQTGAQTLKQKM